MYQLFMPALRLRPYIENYWLLKAPANAPLALQEQIVVDGRADLIINFGVPYLRSNAQGVLETVAHTNLDAQRTYPVRIEQIGAVNLIGVRFAIGGLAPFLPMPMHALSDQVIHWRDVFGQGAADLEGKLYEADNSRAQIALLDAFFLSRLAASSIHPMVIYATWYIAQRGGQIRVRQLSQHIGYSVRSLDRFFRDQIGFSPKWYARLVRLQRTLDALSRDPTQPVSQTALMVGYYDQAHFNKDFKAFMGCTPSEYRAYLLARLAEPPPNLVQFLQDAARTSP
ncbi:MAG: AraC family transcriptional regulator [Chloroflexi bacterium CFX4]|nr:AraC family transcriptional regulator [Chloroflexi bacterium CFX4]MDL1921866.1 AraC family transcriptional regulator [Chloroflexi bacterium CFX3]